MFAGNAMTIAQFYLLMNLCLIEMNPEAMQLQPCHQSEQQLGD
jgi:hypothetical protein